MKRTLIIMAKAPEAGRVKTRLGRTIGMGRAAEIFRRLLRITLEESVDPRWNVIVAVEPRGAVRSWGRLWPREARVIAQSGGDLGARLQSAMRSAPIGPVVVIGADAPAMRRRHIASAFAALGRADAVFGPAADGGFWLIGLARRKRTPRLFHGVRWSSPHALADTEASLPAGLSRVHLEMLRDIDEADDLSALTPRSRR